MKAIFFDIDGTLLSHSTNTVPDSTKKALDRLRKNGIMAVLATGRSLPEIRNLPDIPKLTFDGYITLNGQVCQDGEGNVISVSPITGSSRDNLLTAFREKRIPIILQNMDDFYINYVDDHVKAIMDDIHTPVPPVKEYQGEEIYMGTTFVDKKGEALLLEKLAGCDFTRWHEQGVDIISRGGSKKEGIRRFMEFYSLKKHEIMAVGDGDNDLEMIKYAGIGVAMGNASLLVKEEADYITDDVDHDGIWNMLEHFSLI